MMRRQPKVFIQHLERYVFSLPYCNEKRVLELGSKDGYGANLLSHFASYLTLTDYNGKYLSQAKRFHHYLCPVEFIQINFNDAFPEGKWDTIIAFEIIEHVNDPDNFVREIAEHLPSGGKLVFSVPHMHENIAHKTLFDEESIKKLISKYLIMEEFYIQDLYGISKEPTNNKGYIGVATKV